MPLENLQPLVNLTGNENIAISVLSTMLYITCGIIAALGGFIVLIIRWFLAREKEAWHYVSQFSQALKATQTDLAVIADRAQRKAGR
jgi:hypothetical protein